MGIIQGSVAPTGTVSHVVIRGNGRREVVGISPEGVGPVDLWKPATSLRNIIEQAAPQRGLSDEVNEWRAKNLRNIMRGLWRIQAAKVLGVPTHYGALFIDVFRGNGEHVPYGLASLRVTTTAGVNKIVAVMNTTDAVTAVNFKYHGYGTGTTAEAAGDVALVTELTTQYNPDSTRPTGTQTVGASNNIYRSVATMTPDSGGSIVLREHGLFSAASGGTLLDRSVYAAITLDSTVGDAIQTTFEHTQVAGS